MKSSKSYLVTTVLSALLFVPSKSDREGRIIGGTESTAGEFPWIVSLQLNCGDGIFKHFCGSGTILDARHVVTAGHCVWDKKPEMMQIMAGVFKINTDEPNHQNMEVEEIILHPNYTTGNKAGVNDIAILKLRSSLNLTKYVQPIKLFPPESAVEDAVNCTTVGWGNQFPISKLLYSGSQTLFKISTRIVSSIRCNLAYPFFRQELTTAICATSGLLRGTCAGDSGGSLVCQASNSNGIPYLVGIVSWGWVICGDAIHPDIYTHVRILKDFWNSKVTTGGADLTNR